jgi:hypothetical protein
MSLPAQASVIASSLHQHMVRHVPFPLRAPAAQYEAGRYSIPRHEWIVFP